MARHNLKNARKAKGMTQQEVTDYLNISLSHYKNIESGERLGAIDLWDKMEDLFNVHQRILREIVDKRLGQADSQ